MSVNRDRPHLYVLPEDDANRQLAVGFQLKVDDIRQLKILPVAGGWLRVFDEFKETHVVEMERNPNRLMVLLIDFDGRSDRRDQAEGVIPEGLRDRVFVLGTWTEPEDFRESFEGIGRRLADDCRAETFENWNHELLKHNAAEVDRLRQVVRPFLFT